MILPTCPDSEVLQEFELMSDDLWEQYAALIADYKSGGKDIDYVYQVLVFLGVSKGLASTLNYIRDGF